jgi:hypothetical protein
MLCHSQPIIPLAHLEHRQNASCGIFTRPMRFMRRFLLF